ncbi:MAG: Ig-like domain-containing protein, partial [Gemmatimonadota bacterium]|nr:Ig-like domain-containing protein [Gemmatimonadota bacterium]
MSPIPSDFKPLKAALPWYRSASKLVTAIASTGAAVVSIFSFLYSFGVVGEPESHKTVGTFGASWLSVSPKADTAHAIGDTLHLAATVTDKSGSVLVGVRPRWTSDNPNAATVLPDGSVIIRGPGAATILVTVADLTARSRVFVRQVVSSVDIGGDSAIVLGEGERRAIGVRPLDARGHQVRGIVAEWRVSDTTIAIVDSLGVFVGRNPGRAIITATAAGVAAHAPLTVVPVPAAIALHSGAEQRATAGSALPQPIVVRVTSRRGRPVEGAVVRFRGEHGEPATEPRVALTDADGRARATWTLTDLPGRQTLLAAVEHVDSALAITAEAEPVAANTRLTVMSEQLVGPAATKLAAPVVIRVTDSTSRVLPNLPVSWTVLDGGRVEALAARTDSAGEARAQWTLGPNAGTHRLRAYVGAGRTVPPLTITASALAGVPARLSLVSGDEQQARAGAELAKPIKFRVTDRTSNPVAGATVTLSVSAGSVADTALQTDSLGVASTRWTMGRAAGAHTLVVRVDSVPPLRVNARVLPRAPANLSFHEPPVEGQVGRALPGKIVAVVTDVYGNPVPDAVVTFVTRLGRVTPSRAAADTAGYVRTIWTLGPQLGEQTLTGIVRGSD